MGMQETSDKKGQLRRLEQGGMDQEEFAIEKEKRSPSFLTVAAKKIP